VRRAINGPANHFTRAQVDHDGQVQPAFIGMQIGDIALLLLIRVIRIEVLFEQASHWQRVILVCGGLEFIGRLGA
jgi:hypothetical protein